MNFETFSLEFLKKNYFLVFKFNKSQKIVEKLIESDLETLSPFTSTTATMKTANSKGLNLKFFYQHFEVTFVPFTLKFLLLVVDFNIRVMHFSSIAERGYELHVENEHCLNVYKELMSIGSQYGLKNAGFRAYNSLSCEIGI